VQNFAKPLKFPSRKNYSKTKVATLKNTQYTDGENLAHVEWA
jgi:hypothetical protein